MQLGLLQELPWGRVLPLVNRRALHGHSSSRSFKVGCRWWPLVELCNVSLEEIVPTCLPMKSRVGLSAPALASHESGVSLQLCEVSFEASGKSERRNLRISVASSVSMGRLEKDKGFCSATAGSTGPLRHSPLRLRKLSAQHSPVMPKAGATMGRSLTWSFLAVL